MKNNTTPLFLSLMDAQEIDYDYLDGLEIEVEQIKVDAEETEK